MATPYHRVTESFRLLMPRAVAPPGRTPAEVVGGPHPAAGAMLDGRHRPHTRPLFLDEGDPLVHDAQAGPDDGRDETLEQQADRNWGELLQEVRILQTGVQILTGFLLTLPFQQRFTELDGYQRGLYLVLVVLAVATTGTLVTPVSIHRAVFHRRMKQNLVTTSDRLARIALVLVALLMSGTAALAFDVTLGRVAGQVAGGLLLLGFAALRIALSRSLRHR